MSSKNIVLVSLLVVVIGFFISWGIQDEAIMAQLPDENDIVYYYGEECPNCKDVAEFIDENGIDERVEFEKKEIWGNKENAEELKLVVEKCGLDFNEIGVPFLYADGECLIGTPDVEKRFREKAGI